MTKTGQKIATAGKTITTIVYGVFALALIGFVLWAIIR